MVMGEIVQDVTHPTPVYTTGALTHVLYALHMSDGSLTRASTLLRTQAPAMVADAMRRLATALSSRVTDAWSDAKCARLVASHLTSPLARSTQKLSTQQSTPGLTSRVRTIVRLVPADASAENEIKHSGGHPFVEVALRASKTIWDVAAHLFSKWGVPLRILIDDSLVAPRTRLATLLPQPSNDLTASSPSPIILASFQLAVPQIPSIIFKAARSVGILPDAPPTPPPLPPSPIQPPAAAPSRAGAGRRTYATPPCLTRKKSLKRRASCSPPNSPLRVRQRHEPPVPLSSPSPCPSVLSSHPAPVHSNSPGPSSTVTGTAEDARSSETGVNAVSLVPMRRPRSPSLSPPLNTQTSKHVTTDDDFIDTLLSSGSPTTFTCDNIMPKSMLSFGESDELRTGVSIGVTGDPPATIAQGSKSQEGGCADHEDEKGDDGNSMPLASGHIRSITELPILPITSINPFFSPTTSVQNTRNQRSENYDLKFETGNNDNPVPDVSNGEDDICPDINIEWEDNCLDVDSGRDGICVSRLQLDTENHNSWVSPSKAGMSEDGHGTPLSEKEVEITNDSALQLLDDIINYSAAAPPVSNSVFGLSEPVSMSMDKPHVGQDDRCVPESHVTSGNDDISTALELPSYFNFVENWGLVSDDANSSADSILHHNEGEESASVDFETREENNNIHYGGPQISYLLGNDQEA